MKDVCYKAMAFAGDSRKFEEDENFVRVIGSSGRLLRSVADGVRRLKGVHGED